MEELKRKEANLKAALERIEKQGKDLDEWSATALESKDDDLEKRLIPFDVASEQLVKLQADYSAIDDTMYWLESAFCSDDKKANIDLTTFLKETRNLAKQQFLNKVHMDKIKKRMESGGGGI